MKKTKVESRVQKYIREQHMIAAGERLVAGISGGADSICLFFMLLYFQRELPFTWTAVHVNHCLRGEEADKDQDFVENLCKEHNIAYISYRENVKGYAEKKRLTLEEAGRELRHACFQRAMKETGAHKIFLAHHQNDNAETLLLNLSRGTGLRGLGGIRPVNGNLFRPLLCLQRCEIEEWLRQQGISWREDASNKSDLFARNRIRNHVIPFLEEEINRRTVPHLFAMSEQMRELEEYLESCVAEAEERYVRVQGADELLVCREVEEGVHPFLRKALWKRALTRVATHEKDLTEIHIRSLEELMRRQTGRRVDLPYNVEAIRSYEGVLLRHREQENAKEVQELSLNIPGETAVPWADFRIRCSLLEQNDIFFATQVPHSLYTKYFDYGIIKDGLNVRTRRPGDFLVIDKRGARQKLKSWFINEKIPSEKRGEMPLIAKGSEILWIVGYRRSHTYLISDRTRTILKIDIIGGKEDGRNDKRADT